MGSKRRHSRKTWQSQIFVIAGALAALIFTPTTIVLVIGMLPAMVAAFVDRSREKTRGITVGALNFAGCAPFLMDMWTTGTHTTHQALSIVTDPTAIIIMYAAAGFGGIIDWFLTSMIATYLAESGKKRLVDIRKRQEGLVTRWGAEVSGDLPIDTRGFPLDPGAAEAWMTAWQSKS